MRIAVSACLLGIHCKYNGSHNRRDSLLRTLENHEILPICPESSAMLSCPRTPAEIKEGKVFTRDGEDISAAFEKGARVTMEQILAFEPDLVLLKSRSPSCGPGQIYDGTFSGTLKDGDGVLAALVKEAGIPVLSVE